MPAIWRQILELLIVTGIRQGQRMPAEAGLEVAAASLGTDVEAEASLQAAGQLNDGFNHLNI